MKTIRPVVTVVMFALLLSPSLGKAANDAIGAYCDGTLPAAKE